MIIIFYLFYLVKSQTIQKDLTSGILSCTCESGLPSISINHITLGDTSINGMDKFMMTGWFKTNSTTSTFNNTVFMVTNSEDIQRQHLLAVTLNNNISYASICVAIDQCVIVNATGYGKPFVDDIWAFIMAGVDITNQRMFFKLLLFPNTIGVPEVYSRAINYELNQPWQNLSMVVVKNLVSNQFSYQGFCGNATRVKWYAGFYLEDNTMNIDLGSTMLMQWIGLDDPVSGTATNQVNPFKNLGKYGGLGYSKPTADTDAGVGITYGSGQAIAYYGSKDSFGDHFMMSFWLKANMSSGSLKIPVFTRWTSSQDQILQLNLIYSSGINIKVNFFGDYAQPHGDFQLQNNQFYRVTLIVFTHYNLLFPQSIFNLLVTPQLSNYYVQSEQIYTDSTSDQFFIGDPDRVAVWDTGKIHIHDFRVYSGAYFKVHSTDTVPLLGCHLSLGAIYPHCVQCDSQRTGTTATDTYKACAQALSPEISTSNYVKCPWGQTFTAGSTPPCKSHNLQACTESTADLTACVQCAPPYTVDSSNLCTIDTSIVSQSDMFLSDDPFDQRVRQCDVGIKQCYYEGGLMVQILQCEDGYYLNVTLQSCLACQSTCFTCQNSKECTACQGGKFLARETKLCIDTCPSNYFTDLVNFKCLLACDTTGDNIFSVPDLKQCLSACPIGYRPAGKVCYNGCPIQTFERDTVCVPCAAQCEQCYGSYNIQCNSCNPGYYLEKTKCDTFCEDTTLFRDNTTWACVAQCPALVYQIVDQRRCVFQCPSTYTSYLYTCIQNCPSQMFKQPITSIDANGVSSILFQCTNCNVACTACSDVDENHCTACASGYFLTYTTCKNVCDQVDLSYMDTVNNVCQKVCPFNLFQFEEKKQCVSQCPSPYLGYAQNCILNCPPGLFIYGLTCLQCAAECNTCFGSMKTQCTACSVGYFLYVSTCYANCPFLKPYKDFVNQLCVTECPKGKVSVVSTKECKDVCPPTYALDVDGKLCVNDCPAGQYKNTKNECQQCDLSCSTCSGPDASSCFSCNIGYFLDGTTCDANNCVVHSDWLRSEYYWQCVESCIGSMLKVIDKKMCVSICPTGYFRLNSNCYSTCPSGYFKNIDMKRCDQCATACKECSAGTANDCLNCTLSFYQEGTSCVHHCSIEYYMNSQNYQCEISCPSPLLTDDDGAGNRQCLTNCIPGKYQYQGTCYFICLDGYYGNSNSGKCEGCSLECGTCNGPLNTDCITCSPGFKMNTDGECSGSCPVGYYDSHGCELCSFRCSTCSINQYNCIQCRGDRLNSPLCNCQDGYFDDGTHDKCQKCQSPCITCQSVSYCITCPNNKKPPDCTCGRDPPIQSDWCISCQVAFPTIKFSDNLEQLIIEFGYLISINSFDPYLASNDNCKSIFNSTTMAQLGNVPTCYLDQITQTKIIVNLDYDVTIDEHYTIDFTAEGISDQSMSTCQSIYINNFITHTLQVPDNFPVPVIVLKYPTNIISTCNGFKVSVETEINGGYRPLERGPWKILSRDNLLNPGSIIRDSAYEKHIENVQSVIDVYSANNSDFFFLPSSVIFKNSIYYFEVSFKNFLGNESSAQAMVRVGDESTPSIQIDLSYFGKYYAYEDLLVPIIISTQSCANGIEQGDSGQAYNVQFSVLDLVTGATVYQTTQSNIVQRNFQITIPKGTLTAGNGQRLNVSIVSNNVLYWDSEEIQIQLTEIVAKFTTSDRVIGGSANLITLDIEAYDPSVSDSLLKYAGISFFWQCVNQLSQQQCLNTQLQYIKFNDTRTQYISRSDLQINSSYILYVSVTKGNVTKLINQQLIIVEEMNITELPYQPCTDNKINDIVKPFDQITVVFNPPKNNTWILLIYDNLVKFIKPVPSTVFFFSIQDYETVFAGTNVMQLFFTGYQDFRRIKIDIPFSNFIVNVNPSTGDSLITQFTIKVTPSVVYDVSGFKYSYFYYLDYSLMKSDRSLYRTENGYPIALNIESNNVTTVFPAPPVVGQKQIYILVSILTPTNLTTIHTTNLTVGTRSIQNQRRNLELVQQYLYLQNLDKFTQIQKIYIGLTAVSSRDKTACPAQCGGKGSCIKKTQECMCDQDWFLADCSGGKGDNLKATSMAQDISYVLFGMLSDKELTNDEFYNMLVLQSLQELIGTKYFYNYFASLTDISQNITQIIDYIEGQIKSLSSQSYNTSSISIVENFSSDIKVGMLVQTPLISTLPNKLNSFVYIVTQLYRFNSLQYLQDSTLQSALQSDEINDENMQQELEQQIVIREKRNQIIDQINKRLGELWQQIIQLESEVIILGQQTQLIQASTITLKMKRDFWVILQNEISFNGQNDTNLTVPVKEELSLLQTILTKRVLQEIPSSNIFLTLIFFLDISEKSVYDLTVTTLVFNPYRNQSNFPYPKNTFPLIETVLRQITNNTIETAEFKRQFLFNITQAKLDLITGFSWLNSSIVADPTTIQILNSTVDSIQNYACIWMNTTSKIWHACPDNLYLKGTHGEYVQCNCTKLAPVTAVNDYLYLYVPKVVENTNFLDRLNIYGCFVFLTGLWLLITPILIWRDKRVYDAIIPQLTGFAKITVDQNKLSKGEGQTEAITSLRRVQKKQRISLKINDETDKQKINVQFKSKTDLGIQMADDINDAKKRNNLLQSANVWDNENKIPESETPTVTNQRLIGSKYVSSRASRPNLQAIDLEEISVKEIKEEENQDGKFKSKHTFREFHRNHSLLSIFFRFYKDIGRGFRVTFYYSKLLWMFTISGLMAYNGYKIIDNIAAQILTSLVLRVIMLYLKKNIAKGKSIDTPSCFMKFLSYFCVFTMIVGASVSLLILYYSLPDSANRELFISWLSCIAFDIFILEIILELGQKGYEYYKWKRAGQQEDEEQEDEDQDENNQQNEENN